MTLLRNLTPPAVIAGAALAYMAHRFLPRARRPDDLPLGRIAFAKNLVRTRRRRSR